MFYKALQKRRSNQNKNKKAFTLIELIVVIAIIGVLIAILVPTMNSFVDEARDATALANARTVYSIGQAEITFITMNEGSAPTEADLIAAIDEQIGNLTGTYTLTYANGVLSSVAFTTSDGGEGTYPQVPAAS